MTAAGALDGLLTHVAGKPEAMVRLARVLLAKELDGQAHELCMKALAQAPQNPEVRAVALQVLGAGVPGWYFPMVRDHARHAAYERAMHRAIKPGDRVLEIGTGTGLLAMMAARAGASEVITCETRPAVALMAQEIIRRNKFSDRIRLISEHSTDLAIGVDLERADVVVWDVLSNNLIGAGALPTMEHAVRHLARPGAAVIPASGTIRVALAEDRNFDLGRMESIEGFDLSPFNWLTGPNYQIPVGSDRLSLRSQPGDLFRFDFASGGPFPAARTSARVASTGGRVNGIVQWLTFAMDAGEDYENQPGPGAVSAFAALFYPLPRPIELAPGETFNLCSTHDRLSLDVWAEAGPSP